MILGTFIVLVYSAFIDFFIIFEPLRIWTKTLWYAPTTGTRPLEGVNRLLFPSSAAAACNITTSYYPTYFFLSLVWAWPQELESFLPNRAKLQQCQPHVFHCGFTRKGSALSAAHSHLRSSNAMRARGHPGIVWQVPFRQKTRVDEDFTFRL